MILGYMIKITRWFDSYCRRFPHKILYKISQSQFNRSSSGGAHCQQSSHREALSSSSLLTFPSAKRSTDLQASSGGAHSMATERQSSRAWMPNGGTSFTGIEATTRSTANSRGAAKRAPAFTSRRHIRSIVSAHRVLCRIPTVERLYALEWQNNTEVIDVIIRYLPLVLVKHF